VDGIRTFTDSEILAFYDRMVKGGMADAIFSDGQINSREGWLHAMKSPENFLYVVYADENISAVFWLNSVEAKQARFHYCFFYSAWKKGSIKVGKKILEILMEKRNSSSDDYLLDVLIGVIPSSNEPAIKFAKLLGWQIIGTLPFGAWSNKKQKSESAIISYYTRTTQNENI
jgi:hypothetical protein